MRHPPPLSPGDRIGVTSPSAGVADSLRGRLQVAIKAVESRGYEVVVGSCMDGGGLVSAPAADRARELTAMLTDPSIKAMVPPWGGETAIDLMPLIGWDAIRAAEPTWMVGYSDISTIITPLTLLTGTATIHGNNLMETPYRVPDGLVSWLDIVTMPPGTAFTQTPPGRHQSWGHHDWAKEPEASEFDLDTPGRWTRLDGDGPVHAEGRLIGGCIETLTNLAGTPFLDVTPLAAEGTVVYVEACEDDAAAICRNLHGMRLAGFFTGARAVLVGRTRAPGVPAISQHEAVLDALGGLGTPIVADVECGHVQPYLPLVNGALARVTHDGEVNEITQTLA